jgi:glutaredoxin
LFIIYILEDIREFPSLFLITALSLSCNQFHPNIYKEKELGFVMTNKKKSDRPCIKMYKEIKKNLWIPTTVILAVVAIVLLSLQFLSGGVSGSVAAQNLVDYAAAQGAELEVVDVAEKSGLYEVTATIQGQEIQFYVTKDGKSYSSMLLSMEASNIPSTPNTQPPAATTYTEEDLTKLKEFSQCLADNGVKAYGAGWCGYCKKLKETFGGDATTGADVISPFYLECQNADRSATEHAGTCTEEEIKGFPTIKLDGESSSLSALSSLDDFAAATGCDAPVLS